MSEASDQIECLEHRLKVRRLESEMNAIDFEKVAKNTMLQKQWQCDNEFWLAITAIDRIAHNVKEALIANAACNAIAVVSVAYMQCAYESVNDNNTNSVVPADDHAGDGAAHGNDDEEAGS